MLPERMAFDWMRSTEPPFGEFRTSVPSERWVGSALQREVAETVPLGSKVNLRGLAADQLQAGIGVDADAVAGLDDVDVHQLRQLVDVGIALVEHGRGGGAVVAQSRDLLVELGDLGHRLVGFADRVGDAELSRAAQRLDALARGVETLRELLRRADDRAARRAVVRARRQRLQRIGEAVVDRLERADGAGISVDTLQPVVELRAQVGVRGAGILHAQLFLDVLIERALDRADAHADTGVAAADRDLDEGLADVARRVGVGDVTRNDREPGLGGGQTPRAKWPAFA